MPMCGTRWSIPTWNASPSTAPRAGTVRWLRQRCLVTTEPGSGFLQSGSPKLINPTLVLPFLPGLIVVHDVAVYIKSSSCMAGWWNHATDGWVRILSGLGFSRRPTIRMPRWSIWPFINVCWCCAEKNEKRCNCQLTEHCKQTSTICLMVKTWVYCPLGDVINLLTGI